MTQSDEQRQATLTKLQQGHTISADEAMELLKSVSLSLAMPRSTDDRPKVIDLRSDTVTRPTASMRAAMLCADVGDDVFAEDPVVNKLQETVAAMTAKEAALFVPSGTMGNLMCVLTHCQRRSDEFIVGDMNHIHLYEQGGTASLGSVHPRALPVQPDGTMKISEIESAIRVNDDHFPVTRLICLENTQNRMGGRVLPMEYVEAVADIAKRHSLKLHIDGARIFNAAVKLGVPVSELCKHADSVSICLSKGLAAPVGSVIVGTREFIREARRLRKALGGGMRQAGVIAAAGLVAVQEMVDRLSDDHANAHKLAEGLQSFEGLHIDVNAVDTNLVFISLLPIFRFDGPQLRDELLKHSIKCAATGPRQIRFVTHYEISGEDVDQVIAVFKKILS